MARCGEFLQGIFIFTVLFGLDTILYGAVGSEPSFSIEYVDYEKLDDDDPDNDVVLYECTSPGVNSLKGQSPNTSPRRRLSKMLSGGEPIVCKKVNDKKEMQSIYMANNFFVVKDPKLVGGRLYDEKDNRPLQLPKTVNVGVEFDLKSFPKLEQTDNVKFYRQLVAKLKFLHVLPWPCREELVEFLSISDVQAVTKDSLQVVKQLNSFVTVLDKITKLYYEDYYRTFLLYVFKYDVNLAKKARAKSTLIAALNVVLPKMIDPCFIMSFQSRGKKDANRFCTSYCRVLVAAHDIRQKPKNTKTTKTCAVRWSEGVCRNNRCTCIKPTKGIRIFMPRAPMNVCNNIVVQTNIVNIFYNLDNIREYSPDFMRWVFFPEAVTWNKDLCKYDPE